MSNIILFQFESNEIRTGELDGKAVFCLSDLLAALNSKTTIGDAKLAVSDVFGEGYVINLPLKTTTGTQNAAFVFESGLTFLISRSRTEKGKRMNRWIHAEVLPSIRKTGSYSIASQHSAESLAQWHKDRTDGKEVRRTLSDAIAMFVRYAQAQGSKNADRYFASITHNLINRYVIEAPIDSKIRDKRNRMDREQLRHLTNIEDVLAGLIEARMIAGDDYHEIYQVCKDRAAAIAAVLDISPKPLLPESNQRLINQSLARSLAS
jgi:prophage antirepressor-like protein